MYAWGEREAHRESACSLAARGSAPRRSPYDPGSAVLRTVIANLTGEPREIDPRERSIEIHLPTGLRKEALVPWPSLSFLNEEASDNDAETAQSVPWRVSACELTWKVVFALLGRTKEKRLAPEVFAAEDLLRFSELFRYAGALVARGRFLPDLKQGSETGFEARWRPSFDGVEHRRLGRFAERLPPVARSNRPALHVAREFLDEVVDRLVRVSVVTTLSRAQAERGKFYSAHDAWFSALRGEERRVRWENASDLEFLCGHLRAWRQPVEGGRTGTENLVFRVEEPAESSLPWALWVEVADGEQAHAFFAKGGAHPHGVYMLSLGQAATLFTPLQNAVRSGDELGCHLSAFEAHAFLTTYGAVLSAAGFTVRLPAWWQPGPSHVLSLAADISPQPSQETSDGSLSDKVDIQWAVLFNGEPITKEELRSLWQAQSPLVYFRGRWIQVDLRQIQEALRIEQRGVDQTHSAVDVVRLALGTGIEPGGLNVSAVTGRGWVDPLLQRLNGDQPFEPLNAPDAFNGALRPYQVRGYSWLVYMRGWGFGACLADDMGLGKTIQALAFLLHEKARGEKRPVLLVGPMSVLGNWVHEAQRFAPSLRCLLHHGAQRWHGDSFAHVAQSADVVITSYHLLFRDYADLRKVAWSGVLLDEAQNIKNPHTHQAQAARALQADYRIALTGTPIENHVGDVWSIMDFLNPGLLGKRKTFHDKFFCPIQSGTDPGARSRLRRVTAPFILRRLKTDKQIIGDLPDKIEGKVYCPLTLEQARLYQEVLDVFNRDVEQSEGITRRGMILAVLTRLKQVCNHPAHYLGETQTLARRSGKLERLEEMLEEVFERGECALVFTQYAEMGGLLKRHLCHAFARDVPFLHGGVARRERDRLVREFQESSQPQAFVLSLKAGGTGLNLTRATHVFHYDRWWNPAVENQATDRAFRIGQTRNVMVHKFICGGTLEDRIDAMIENKTALANEIVVSGEAVLTELSNEELRNVLRLSESAVADENE